MRIVKYPVATTIRQNDNGLSVVYHSTEVVHVSPHGVITLNSGGWRTPTTKQRMNQYAPGVSVYAKRGEWFVTFEGQTLPFVDGMKLASTR